MPHELPGVVAAHIAAINASDIDAVMATFAPDAIVNHNRREIVGTEAIRRFVSTEIISDKVTMEVRDVIDHHGDVVVRARYDGTYDKTNLPTELVLTNYFVMREERISMLIIIFNQPSPH